MDVGKVKELGLSKSKQAIVESKLDISITTQCKLVDLNRSSLYYKPKAKEQSKAIKEHIYKIYEEIPSYGYLKVHQQLIEDETALSQKLRRSQRDRSKFCVNRVR